MLALQEVDHHHDWLSPMLAKAGYRSLFVKKPYAPGLAFSPTLEDGCSLFYRTADASEVGGGGGEGGGPEGGGYDKRALSTRTTLDLLDAHTFTFAVEERNGEDGVDDSEGAEGKKNKKNSNGQGRVVQNQVAAIALLRVCGAGGGRNDGRTKQQQQQEQQEKEESLVVAATTHLKASKDEYGETMRARQVTYR